MISIMPCTALPIAKGNGNLVGNSRKASVQQLQGVYRVAPMRYFTAVILCLGACLVSSLAYSDPPGKRLVKPPYISLQGGCIAPPEPNDEISLDEMRVTFRSKRDSYTVEARYELFNTGETTTVMVGVPKYGRADKEETSPEPIIRDFINFDAWVDGRKADFAEVRDFFTDPNLRPVGGYCHMKEPSETRWMTRQVTFKGKATTTIRVRYEAFYHNHYWQSGRLLDSGFYHDSVGRYWKDKIKRAFFVTDTTGVIYMPSHHWIPRVVTYTGFISVDEIVQWEPSSLSYRLIMGEYEAAQWRAIVTRYFIFGFEGIPPMAPTSCTYDFKNPQKYLLKKERRTSE